MGKHTPTFFEYLNTLPRPKTEFAKQCLKDKKRIYIDALSIEKKQCPSCHTSTQEATYSIYVASKNTLTTMLFYHTESGRVNNELCYQQKMRAIASSDEPSEILEFRKFLAQPMPEISRAMRKALSDEDVLEMRVLADELLDQWKKMR